MDGQILERDHECAELAAAMREASHGAGCVVLISGEAGAGKSSVVRAVLPTKIPTLVGHCDDATTRRTLGPFRDLAGSVGAELARALDAGDDLTRVTAALRKDLDRPGEPTLLVIEDVHWADDATLDLLNYLVRRVESLPLVLVLTYRDDLGRDHPLRRVLGQAACTARLRRLPLAGLSEEAVRRLSVPGSPDPARVHEVTGGNPFFVTEVLAAGDTSKVPASVTDAVLARLRGLDPGTRDDLEQLAVVPSMVDRWLVDVLVPGGITALTDAEQRGLLTVGAARVGFRHELIRRTIADALPTSRRVQLNSRVLAVLVARPGADLSRIVHHAAEAGDLGAVRRYGPAAAEQAIRARSHREAATHLRLVLEQQHLMPTRERAELLNRYAVECCTIGDVGLAVREQRRAITLWETLGDRRALGAALRWFSRMRWLDGDIAGAERTAGQAITVLEDAGDTGLLALALSNLSQLHMVASRATESIEVGERAMVLAAEAGDTAVLAHALNNVGCARWQRGEPEGKALVEEATRVATAAGDMDEVCRAYANLAAQSIEHYRLDEAECSLRAGLEIAESAEHLFFFRYMSVLQATLKLERAHWEEAEQAARIAVDAQPGLRCLAMIVLGRSRVRRGVAGGDELLNRAWELAVSLGDAQWAGPAAAARAEAAWLRGDPAAIPALVETVHAEATRLGVSVVQAELGYWLTVTGRRTGPTVSEHPYAVQAAGRWREAADLWRAAGCPYEHASALAQSPDPDDVLAAMTELDAIGARPLARLVRIRLRDLGVAQIPRGPNELTRKNPAGLTGRQWQIVCLISDGLTNAEIAERLVVSVRTVEHHVAAALNRLGARNRREAATLVADLEGKTTAGR